MTTDEEGAENLLSFYMDSQQGPCIGLSRLERWERAEKLGAPPIRERCCRGPDAEQWEV